MLSNIALHLDEYERKYGKAFLQSMLFAFETNDNTGLFPIKQFACHRVLQRSFNEITY